VAEPVVQRRMAHFYCMDLINNLKNTY
jgi:SUMO ligase MMS21 Smc5/6 complex component